MVDVLDIDNAEDFEVDDEGDRKLYYDIFIYLCEKERTAKTPNLYLLPLNILSSQILFSIVSSI